MAATTSGTAAAADAIKNRRIRFLPSNGRDSFPTTDSRDKFPHRCDCRTSREPGVLCGPFTTRPDFSYAARPEVAEPLYKRFCEALRELGVPVQTGVFGARMQVELVNDGPVTITLDVRITKGRECPVAMASSW